MGRSDNVQSLQNFKIVLGIMVVMLPMRLPWRLQVAVSRNLVLDGMFGLGVA